MAYVANISCCGVGEVVSLFNQDSVENILKEAKRNRKGFLVAYFVKYPGAKKYEGEEFMKKLLKHGFKKSSRRFINPNTGNTIQPLHYLMKKHERSSDIYV